MNKANIENKVVEAAISLCGKGEPVLLTGTTGAGKTTSVSGLTEDYITQQYLSIGEANCKGSLKSRSCIATDHPDIPNNCLIMRARLNTPDREDYGDDLQFFGNIVYAYINAVGKNIRNPEEKIRDTIVNRLINPLDGNASLEAKLSFVLNDENMINKLVNIVINMGDTMKQECKTSMEIAKRESKGQRIVKNFIRKLSDPKFNSLTDEFWKITDNLLSSETEKIHKILEDAGAEFTEDGTFVIVFDKDLLDDNIDENDVVVKAAYLLIHSEQDSVEHLLDDINIIFRANDEIFDCDRENGENRFVVMEHEGRPVRVLHLIDTMGLFHQESDPQAEATRITDLMKSNYCSQGIIVINSFIDDTTKKGYAALEEFFQNFNGNSKFYLFFTHWDEYLKTFAKESASKNKRSRFGQKITVEWADEYKNAEDKQKELIKNFHNALERNNSSHKPVICKESFAACMIFDNEKMEDFLRTKEMEYNHSWKRMIKAIHRDQTQNINKIKVDANIVSGIDMDLDNTKVVKVKALKENLSCCIDLTESPNRLWAPTANAVKRHWSENGKEFSSKVTVTEGGYCNINTTFIAEIRRYAENYLSAITFNISGMLTPETPEQVFCESLMNYLKADQKFGKETAKAVYRWAADCVKTNNKNGEMEWRLQYEYVNRLFRVTSNNIFRDDSLTVQNDMQQIMKNTVKICAENFINQHCITF